MGKHVDSIEVVPHAIAMFSDALLFTELQYSNAQG